MRLSGRSLVYIAATAIGMTLVNGCSGESGTTLPTRARAPIIANDAAPLTSTAIAGSSAGSTSALATKTTSGGASGEQALSSDAFVNTIGVNTHLWWGAYTNFSAVQSALTGLGIRHIRDGMVWVDWGSGYYDKLNALAAVGIHSTLTTALNQDPAKIATYIKYVPSSLEAIEAPNEPNVDKTGTSWASPIRAFQQSLYTAIRSNPANARISILGPAIAYTDAAYAVLGDLSQYLDAGNMHDYFGGNPPDSDWIKARMAGAAAVSGSKQIIATETGYCTATGNQGVTDSVVGKYSPRAFLEQFNAGVTRTLKYELLDDGTNPANFWDQCGLMHQDFTPKPSYVALKSLIGLLSDQTTPTPRTSLAYTLLGNTTAVHHTLLQKNDGTMYLAMWLNSSDFDQAHHVALTVAPQAIAISFGSPVASLQAYTYDTAEHLSPHTIAVTQNSAQINITDSVTVFKITPASGSVTSKSAPVITNAAAHWSLDEGRGLTAADSVSAAGNATFAHNSTWTGGLFAGAAGLSPSSYLTAPAGLINTSQSYSVSTWLLLADTSIAHTAITVEGKLTAAFSIDFLPGHGFSFLVDSHDANWHNPWIRASQNNITPTIGTWYNVVAIYDKTNCAISLYVNGTLQNRTPGCATFAGGVTHFGHGQYESWSGAIDETNFYQRVLTRQEISALVQT